MFKKLIRVLKRLRSKIIMKLLHTPAVKRRLEEISRAYESDQIAIVYDEDGMAVDRDLVLAEQGAHLNFSHYLPDTEERIEKLRRLINERPVAIILHGPSLKELEERISELKDCDICYFGLNDFWVGEEHILQQINRHFSVVMCGGAPITQVLANSDFLERQENNMFIAPMNSLRPPQLLDEFDLDGFIKKYDRKLLFFECIFTSIKIHYGLFLPIPSIEYPLHFPMQNSFSMLLSLALIGKAPLVVIFGGDGGRIDVPELHFKEYASASTYTGATLERSLAKDTRIFNVTMPLILEKIYKLYNLEPVDIINCSEQSHYTPFRKLSYDETISLLENTQQRSATLGAQ